MIQPLLALSTGELQRLAACVRSLQSPPAEAALNQHQIASERPQVRQELLAWLAKWQRRGGSNGSLDLAISLLLEQRHQQGSDRAELVWSGPHGGTSDITRDQAVLMRELVERCEQRLLITTFNIWRGGFIAELLDRIQERLEACPDLEARMVVNIPRGTSNVVADQIRKKYIQNTWLKLWDAKRRRPSCYFDPRSLDLGRKRPTVFHVKCCVADTELLVTSANLSDSAQLDNCELGVHFPDGNQSPGNSHADAVWAHFDRLIHRQPAALVPIDESLTPPGQSDHGHQ